MPAVSSLQRPQEIKEVELVGRAQAIEVADHLISFRSAELTGYGRDRDGLYVENERCPRLGGHDRAIAGGAGVGMDGGDKVGGTAIVEQEDPLAEAPERRGAEFVRSREPLVHAVREGGAHVMEGKIGEGSIGRIVEVSEG